MRAITSPTRPRSTPSGLTRTRVRSDTTTLLLARTGSADRVANATAAIVRSVSAKHTGSALTGAAVLFVLLRLLAVSHYDWHTAFALLHTLELDDAPGLFLGTFMADDRISTVLLMIVT